MQILFDSSEEFGLTSGLNLIPGKIKKIFNTTSKTKVKIPVIGWYQIKFTNEKDNFCKYFFKDLEKCKFYFIHSYCATDLDKSNLLAFYEISDVKIPAIVKKNNIIGCQFHPEKSGEAGLKVLKNFINYEFN